jgi:hypothetical protein
MSYRAGSYGLERIGIPSGPPRIRCDHDGCGRVFEVRGRGIGSIPPAWFLDGKSPPGWKTTRTDERRIDYCPDHRLLGEGTTK